MAPLSSQVRDISFISLPLSRKVGESDDLAVTVYVIADFDSHEGLELARESLKFMVFVVYFDTEPDRHVTGIDALGQNSGNFYPKL